MSRPRNYTVFRTELKWMGIQWSSAGVSRVTIGHPSKAAAQAVVSEKGPAASTLNALGKRLLQRLVGFAAGTEFDLRDIPLELPAMTEFQGRVLDACRNIPYGETLSYGQVATLAGSPGAARAVGNVMANNRVPILIPCHRVVGSQQSLGGFSAPDGLTLKQRMLDLESKHVKSLEA